MEPNLFSGGGNHFSLCINLLTPASPQIKEDHRAQVQSSWWGRCKRIQVVVKVLDRNWSSTSGLWVPTLRLQYSHLPPSHTLQKLRRKRGWSRGQTLMGVDLSHPTLPIYYWEQFPLLQKQPGQPAREVVFSLISWFKTFLIIVLESWYMSKSIVNVCEADTEQMKEEHFSFLLTNATFATFV